MYKIFDTHAHYDDESFDSDRDEILQNLKLNNIYGVLNASVDLKSSEVSVELAKKYDHVYCAVGIHPQNINNLDKNYINNLENLILNNNKIIAIGEIGLDYYFDNNNKNSQKNIFEEQINLSLKHDLPILVHDREAHFDTLEILKKYRPKGAVHCFSGSLEMAKEIINLNMYLGIGGVLTFKNSKTICEVVKNIPLEYLVFETDAPYLAPVPFRGKRCISAYIKYVAERLSEILNTNINIIYDKIYENSLKLFNINV